ncbi:MAG TPA: glutamate--tRNA ligase [Gemmatimonadales bacterium]|nr:glutamate--tRNA ligase [Gemmatimonadales bacterium]
MTVRLRFAPSPTGYLHVGGARTALFNWLYVRKVGGAFLLRIEDTDKQRSTDAHTQVILDGLTWLGLDWDEEVVFQGARVERHREMGERLLRSGAAYEEEGAVRFRMPQGEVAWDDAVYGPIAFKGADIKDWIILRSDRTPTYNFSVVVDDIDMRITHVMRGDDHISNTPKQIAVYGTLGAAPPVFAHVPMIHGMDGKKLSKRHGATAVGDYQQLGILPAAMRNFLALLGWSPGGDRELFLEPQELIQAFSVEGIQRKSAVFDFTKLKWMNGQHISRTSNQDLAALAQPILAARGFDSSVHGERVLASVAAVKERSHDVIELATQVMVRLDRSAITLDDKARQTILKDPDGFRTALGAARERLTNSPDRWEPAHLEGELRALADSLGMPAGKVFQPIRIALTGSTVSEPVNILLSVVGHEESLARMTEAESWPERLPGNQANTT